MEMHLFFLTLATAGSNTVYTWDSATEAKAEADQAAHNPLDANYEKRQLVPMPRIGRSLVYPSAKRQSIIPAPRIGRSDKSSQPVSMKTARSIDCNSNPELCESADSGFGSNGNDELVEPIDIQLRAAFIPRLGKRAPMEQDSDQLRHYLLFPSHQQFDYSDEPGNLDEEASRMYSAVSPRMLKAMLENSKRAIPYTPRIGRAVFAPRIGKKATFVPRIG